MYITVERIYGGGQCGIGPHKSIGTLEGFAQGRSLLSAMSPILPKVLHQNLHPNGAKAQKINQYQGHGLILWMLCTVEYSLLQEML
jgi:hypothetical protein